MIGFAASPAPPVVSRRLAGACCLALLSGALACRAETQKRETGAPAADVPVAAIPAVPAPDSGRDATPMTADEAPQCDGSVDVEPDVPIDAAPEAEVPGTAVRDLRACDRGDPSACVRAADALAEGLSGAPQDPARARELYALACENGRGDACRRLALLKLAAPVGRDEGRAAAGLLDRACNLGFLDACATLGDVYLRGTEVPLDVYQGLLRLQRACVDGYAGACVSIKNVRQLAESYDLPLPRAFPSTAVPAQPPLPEAACPPLFLVTTATGGGERLDRGLRPIPPAALLAALPESIPDWTTVDRRAAAAGEAGRRAGGAWATYRSSERTVQVSVVDQFLNCTLQPGTGAAMLAARPAPESPGPVAIELDGQPAARRASTGGDELEIWLGDRCTLVFSAAPPATEEDLRAAASRVDFARLRRECARREAPGWP